MTVLVASIIGAGAGLEGRYFLLKSIELGQL